MSIEPGLYVHSETNRRYRVLFPALFPAQWWHTLTSVRIESGQEVGVYCLDGKRSLWVWPLVGPATIPRPIMTATWSGRLFTEDVTDLRCIVYVGLSGDGHVSVRSVAEFEEIVQLNGKDVPRFVRVGD